MSRSRVCHCACACAHSWVRLFVTVWTVASQTPLSMGILQARMLEWIAIPFSMLFPTSGCFPDPGIEPMSLVSPALAGGFFFFFLLLSHQGSPSVLEFKSKNSYLCRFPREVPWRLMGRCLSLRSQPCPHADPAPHSWAMVTASTTAAASTSATATEMSHHSSLKEHI